MTDTLTPGRWRGLQNTSTNQHIFTILAFDQRGSYVKMLPPDTAYDVAVQIKTEVLNGLTPYTSAVLLDTEYGMLPAAYMNAGCGLLFSLEKSGYSGDATYRSMEFYPDWNVEKLKRTGASAVKLLAYYHPDTGALAEEIEDVIAGVISECHKYDLPLFLEPLTYSLDKNISKESAEFAATRPQAVIETARRLGALKPDVLKMEAPVDAAFNSDRKLWQSTCEAISAASPVPWVLLSAGVDFETFAEQTEIACKAGASGFLAGRAIWKEVTLMSPEDRATFISGKATDRTKKLVEIATKYSRPWTEFYSPMDFKKGWYSTY